MIESKIGLPEGIYETSYYSLALSRAVLVLIGLYLCMARNRTLLKEFLTC